MKIWNGKISAFYEDDKCKSCLYPQTCAILELMKEHSKGVAKTNNKHFEIIISECPCRDIK